MYCPVILHQIRTPPSFPPCYVPALLRHLLCYDLYDDDDDDYKCDDQMKMKVGCICVLKFYDLIIQNHDDGDLASR